MKYKENFKKYFYILEKNFSTYKHRWIFAVIFLAVSISVFALNINRPISKKELLKEVESVLKGESGRSINKFIRVDDEKVSNEDLKPLVRYYAEHRDDVDKLIKNLNYSNKSGKFSIRINKSIFGDDYYLDLKKVNIVLKKNIDEAKILINGREAECNKNIKVIPGTYNISYELKSDFGDVTGENEESIFEDSDINVEVNAAYLTVYSNFSDADVVINNKKIDKKVSEVKGYGPIPLNKEIKIYVEKEFPWGLIKSDEIMLEGENIIKLDINMANYALVSEMENTINKFYESVFNALNKKDKSLMLKVREDARDNIYDQLYKKTILFSNNYEVSNLELKIENSEFMYENGTYKANILTNVKYNISKNILPFVKNNNEELFLIALVYENGEWLVNSGQKISVDSIQE